MTDDACPSSIQLSPPAISALDQLPLKAATAIVEFITGTLPGDPRDPRGLSKPLRYELSGCHVARRGDYRVTFRILDDDHVLLIGRIEHRALHSAAVSRGFWPYLPEDAWLCILNDSQV